MGVAAAVVGASDSLRRVGDVGDSLLGGRLLLLLAPLSATALALAASSLRLALILLEYLQDLGQNATTSAAASSVASTTFAALRLGLL